MSKPLTAGLVLCPNCAAENANDYRECWLCGGKLAGGEEVVAAELVEENKPGRSLTDSFFLVLTVACLALMILIGIGLCADDPSWLIPYAVVMTPALLATGGRALLAYSAGERVSGVKLFLHLLISVSITIAVLIVLAAAAIIALVVFCFQACAQMGNPSGS